MVIISDGMFDMFGATTEMIGLSSSMIALMDEKLQHKTGAFAV